MFRGAAVGESSLIIDRLHNAARPDHELLQQSRESSIRYSNASNERFSA